MIGLRTLARVAGELRRDVAAAHERDPAARGVSPLESLATWPGVRAPLAHRVARALHEAGVPLAARAIAATARALTGIEIHPVAEVGDGLFIDHGMGVVFGETAQIGENATLYQGVTLGGTGFAAGKRHPTVQDNVTIGSGAKLLGPIRICHGAKDRRQRGGGPRHATELHRGRKPGHTVRVEGRRPEGPDADWVHLPDPIADALSRRIGELERELDEARGEPAHPRGDVLPVRGPNPAGG